MVVLLYNQKQSREAVVNVYQKVLTLFGPGGRGHLGTPQFFAITLRAFEVTLWNLVTFPNILYEIRWNKKVFKIGNCGHVIWE